MEWVVPEASGKRRSRKAPLLLVVDDESLSRQMLCAVLKKEGYQAAEAEGGIQALKLFLQLRPDIVLLDAKMPGMNGFETCAQLQKLPQGKETPVLIVTALGDDDSVKKAFLAGASDYVTKPVNLVLLRHRLRFLLQVKHAAGRVESLARFPAENPYPVLRVNHQGTLEYANHASWPLLAQWGCAVGDQIPEVIHRVVSNALTADSLTNMEVNLDDRAVLLTIAPVANGRYVNLYGYDITREKATEKELRQRNRELALFHQADRLLNSTLDLDQVLLTALQNARAMLDVASCSVWLINRSTDELVCWHGVGPQSHEIRHWRLRLGRGIAGWAALHGESVVVPDTQRDDRHFAGVDQQTGVPIRSVLCVPLQVKEETLGVLQVVDTRPNSLDTAHLKLMEPLASSAAIAIENARLFKQAQRELAERKRTETALAEERAHLSQRVVERTAELEAANAELARAARLKDEFLASMSHELRTPLNAILGLSEALQEEVYGPLTKKQARSLHSIEESGRHLLSLVNDVLDVSKIEAGRMELQIQRTLIARVCEASLRLIKQSAKTKRIEVFSNLDRRVTSLEADQRRLKQMLVNLLSNAVKFTPEGGSIGLDVVGELKARKVHFTVWDTGIGISKSEIGRLFAPFVQLDSALSRQYAGSGLGLSLVYRLAKLHGGDVSVESEPGQGSRFTVTIPWEPAKTAPLTSEIVAPVALVPPSVAPESPYTILLAEDNRANIEAISECLLALGYQVVVVQDGLEAVKRTRERRPDLILMDILMPGMSGLEAIRHIRADADQQVASIPIVVITARVMPGDREECMAAGADEYLPKPVSLKRLIEVIETKLAQSSSGVKDE